MKSVQNLRTFWRITEKLLILALLCSLYSKQTFKVHLGVVYERPKHMENDGIGLAEFVSHETLLARKCIYFLLNKFLT